MKSLDFGRFALTMGVTAVLLAGCGGSQMGVPQTGAVPPVRAVAQNAITQSRAHRASGSSGDLLYLGTAHGILMLTYPDATLVGTLPSSTRYPYVCADPGNGNVFVAERGVINEYAHGGTSIIATLTPGPYDDLAGCSVDPTTGNLAIAASGNTSGGAILIYSGAQGKAAVYADSTLQHYDYCAYDNRGNLFVAGYGQAGKKGQFGARFAELPAGSSKFTDITINGLGWASFASKVQWDGTYFALHEGSAIYQVQVSGSTGTIVGTTTLNESNDLQDVPALWVQGNTVIAPFAKHLERNPHGVAYWRYPSGGNPTKTIRKLTRGKYDILMDLTLSTDH